MRPPAPKVGLVLAGGAARGAYEVGVLEHIVENVSRDLGFDVPLDILCGTSVGAMNVCCIGAFSDEPRARVARLASIWTGLRIREVLRPVAAGMIDAVRGLFGSGHPLFGTPAPGRATSLFDPRPLESLLRSAIPFERIDAQLRAGRISAVTVSATQVATGRTVVFVQRPRATTPLWSETPAVIPRAVRLRPIHTLASAAVPLMFPAVRIDGRYYCDGGLRQNIPVSPARRLGATHLIIVNPKQRPAGHASDDLSLDPKQRRIEHEREEAFPGPLFLLGKTLNALLLDRIENEIDRFEKINAILEAGSRRYGPSFVDALNSEMGYPAGKGLCRLHSVHIRSSENIGQISSEYVRSGHFHVPGMLGSIMKRLADADATREADLLSYVLFDGEFAGRLVEIGRADAARHHDELCRLFSAQQQLRESA